MKRHSAQLSANQPYVLLENNNKSVQKKYQFSMKDKLDMAEIYIQKLVSQPISMFRGPVLSGQPLDRTQGAMMLVDGNLDGAISPEELQKVINFVKAQQKNETIET